MTMKESGVSMKETREMDLHVDVIMQDIENQLLSQRANLSFGDILKKLPRYTSDIKAAINIVLKLKQLLKLEFALTYSAAINMWSCSLGVESVVIKVESSNPAEAISKCCIQFYAEMAKEGLLPNSQLNPSDLVMKPLELVEKEEEGSTGPVPV